MDEAADAPTSWDAQRFTRALLAVVCLAALTASFNGTPPAQANVTSCMNPCCSVPCVDIGYQGPQMINSNQLPTLPGAGPLIDVWIGNELGCQIARQGDNQFEMYSPTVKPGDCGTFLWDGTTLYAPNEASHSSATWSIGGYRAFTPISQSQTSDSLGGLGGPSSGTAPVTNSATTVVAVGSTGMVVTEVDTYVSGNDFYTTNVTVDNPTDSARTIILYRAGDCFLQVSDASNGFKGQPKGAIGCSVNVDNTPNGRIEQWVPLTAGSNYMEDFYSTVWRQIGLHLPFPDTCTCSTNLDSGAGLSWSFSIPAHESVYAAHNTRFSQLGVPPPPPPPIPPAARFKATSSSGTCGPHPVSFADQSAGGTYNITGWAWDFGDGATSTDPSPTHQYAQPGQYTVTETVTVENGMTSTHTSQVVATEGTMCIPRTISQDNGQAPRPPHDGVDDQVAGADSDGDGWIDRVDNCPLDANPSQTDADDDLLGDACDADADNDGIVNAADDCAAVSNADQENLDGDAMGDACDDDRDGDLVPDATDNCPQIRNPLQENSDLDAAGDACSIFTYRDGAAPSEGARPLDKTVAGSPAAQAATGSLAGILLASGVGLLAGAGVVVAVMRRRA